MNKIEEWKTKLSEQEESGLTQAVWCAENNIGLAKFRYWKRKIDRLNQKE